MNVRFRHDNIPTNATEAARAGCVDLFAANLAEPVPTKEQPGTIEKVEAMRERMLRGEHLHHPLDARRYEG